MFAVGVLAFLFVDVFEHAFAIVERAVTDLKDGRTGVGRPIGLTALLAFGFAAGSAGLAMVERHMRRRNPPPVQGASPEAATLDMATTLAHQEPAERARALRVGMTIAAAIGLHNFAEGLAIGVSASTGEIGLATVLIVGFALHNATEGFGIVGPLGDVRPTWRWLAIAGLVGGGPTFIGSLVGYNVTSEPLELGFYAGSGGAIPCGIGGGGDGMGRLRARRAGLGVRAGRL